MSDRPAQSPEAVQTEANATPANAAGTPHGRAARRAPPLAVALLGIALMLAALAGAWLQGPRPVPAAQPVAFAPGDPDWWRYPLESNPGLRLPAIQGNLRGVHARAEGQRVWVVGEGGLILHSADGGVTWRQQHPQPAAPAPAARTTAWPGLIASAHAMDQPAQNTVPSVQQYEKPLPNQSPTELLKKRPITKAVAQEPTKAEPSSAPLPNYTNAIEPRQQNIAPPQQPTDKTAPADAKKAEVAKPVAKTASKTAKPARPAAARPAPTQPAPKQAALEPPPEDVDLNTVFFLDAQRGWAAGDQGMIWTTRDGGAHWRAGFVGEHQPIVALAFDNGYLLAISAQSKIFWSQDGTGDWKPVSLSQMVMPNNLEMFARARAKASQFQNGIYFGASGYWRVGAQGALRYTRNPANGWQPRPSGTDARLTAVAFADPRHGWAVGDAGVILHSGDGGLAWQPQSGGAAALEARSRGTANQVYPAPWTWPTLLLGVGLMALGARRMDLSGAVPASGESAGIAGLFVSDRPLKPGDTDHLGHTAIARGLADFIRNERTEPGLTLAVTGSWGSGKSSIMRLLEHDLKRAGFRPAWFNAWHHQQEGRQLASMFNTIRKQAVPAIHTPPAWRVRAVLFWNRGWFYRLLALGVLGLFLLGLFEARDKQAPLTQLRQAVIGAITDVRPVVITSASLEKLKKGGVLQPPTLATLASHAVWHPQAGEACRETAGDCRFDDLEQLYASLNQLMAPARLTDEEKQALAEAAQHLGDQPRTMLGVLLGALVVPLLLGKGLAVYGLSYLDFLKRLLPERGKVEGKEAVGTMETFRTEFCNLTQALEGRLVLFIDDLDRCNCETVNEVLELVNYLVSVGRCFVVLGMAMEHVSICIEPKNPKLAKEEHALQYLKKLVNIEVPVPKADLPSIRAMLKSQPKNREAPEEGAAPSRHWAAWGLSLALLLVLTWGMNRTWGLWHQAPQPRVFQSALATTPPIPAATGVLTGAPAPAPPAPGATRAASAAKARGPVGLLPGAVPETGLGAALPGLLGLTALLAGIAWPTRARWLDWLQSKGILRAIHIGLGGVEHKHDTQDFLAALECWHQVIVAGDPTPRGIKRFVNRVRFLAMMEQALESQRIPEGVLVGLAALHHARVELPEGLELSAATDWEPLIQDGGQPAADAAARAELARAIQAAIQATPRWEPTQTPAQVERFLHMVEHMHVR